MTTNKIIKQKPLISRANKKPNKSLKKMIKPIDHNIKQTEYQTVR